MMTTIRSLLLASAVTFLASVSRADSFQFSFDFGVNSDNCVSGTFDGIQIGNGVVDISNLVVNFGGIKMPGNVQATEWSHTDGFNDFTSVTELFFDGALNHFNFCNFDANTTSPYPSDFWFFNLGVGNANAWAQASMPVVDALGIDMAGFWSGYTVSPEKWTMSRVITGESQHPSRVPETSRTGFLLCLGFVVACVLRQRSIRNRDLACESAVIRH